jgi:O-antigen ligase
MTQLYKPKSSVREAQNDNLFSGIWIRWRDLTIAERFVCATIVLMPVCWIVGLHKYIALLLLLGVAVYEWLQYRELRLKRPNLPVVALIAFGTYQVLKILVYYYVPGRARVFDVILLWFSPALLLWYIQSNKIRIRMEVVAWACTVSVIQVIGFWLLLQFVLPETIFSSVRLPTLLGLFTGKQDDFSRLVPYQSSGATDDLKRFSFFFVSPEVFAVVAGFFGLVALEIKNRFWSLLLFLACVFLIFLSATRVVWVAFPIVLGLRYLFSTFGKNWGPPITFALIAVVSFTTLSIPPATNLIFDQLTYTTQSITEFRANSTNARLEVYSQTWKAIQENPLWGHITSGPVISLNGPSYNVVGSHSIILGDLLYMNGLVGTGIFLVFWISLFIWFYRTRAGRPLTGFCVLILYTLVSPTMASLYAMPLSSLIVLLCAAINRPKLKPGSNKSLFKKLHHT